MLVNTTEEARGLAEKFLADPSVSSSIELVILDEQTIETDFGWVFFWTSKEYHETGDFLYAIAGNAPLIVDRRDGSVHATSTADPVEKIVADYRRSHAEVR